MPGINGPTVPNARSSTSIRFTLMTGEVSVNPYPSMMGTFAAVKIRISRTWQAAPPLTIATTLLPSASRHLLKISLLASDNCRLYQAPIGLIDLITRRQIMRPIEQLLLHPRQFSPFMHDPVIYLLQQPRHRHEHLRLHLLQVLPDRIHALRIIDRTVVEQIDIA